MKDLLSTTTHFNGELFRNIKGIKASQDLLDDICEGTEDRLYAQVAANVFRPEDVAA